MSEKPSSQPPTCQLFRAGDGFFGKQGLTYAQGISAERAGSRAICMHIVNIPPGARAKTHSHEEHETAIFCLSGRARMWHGDQLENVMDAVPGDMIYIPPGVPHLPTNPSPDEPFVAVIARTDPNEQESVVLHSNLDALVPLDG